MTSCCKFICQAMTHAPIAVSADPGVSRQKKHVRSHKP